MFPIMSKGCGSKQSYTTALCHEQTDYYCAATKITAASFSMTHLCCHCSAVLFFYSTECTLHLRHDIIDMAFNLLTWASKDIIRLRLLALLVTFVLFAFWNGSSQCCVFIRQLTWLFSHRMELLGGQQCVRPAIGQPAIPGCGPNHKANLYCTALWSIACLIAMRLSFPRL